MVRLKKARQEAQESYTMLYGYIQKYIVFYKMDQRLELIRLTHNKVSHFLTIASETYKRNFIIDEVKFDLRGAAAGQFVARYSGKEPKYSIRINNKLLDKYGETFIEEVVPHEVAHLVVFQLYGKRYRGRRILPHGVEWKAVMRTFMREPQIRHQFEVENNRLPRFNYVCGCKGKVHELTIIRHNKVNNKGARYTCKRCGKLLSLES